MFGALQKTDPRCEPAEALNDDDKKSLAELGEIIKAIMEQNKPK